MLASAPLWAATAGLWLASTNARLRTQNPPALPRFQLCFSPPSGVVIETLAQQILLESLS
ncbi:hypothetical protein BJX63DRAFT_393985 [Aspergillus granulosus]|uniref:Secreted protein n=1 Tax=Aspergillus granulosus TaxID=176169 RepID=A0ABR4HDG4_9EURO